MVIVQTHLTETAASMKDESDKQMQDLEAAFNRDQKTSSRKSVKDHTEKHLTALTETLSRRRELFILNQPTLNEAITMKSERRAYPARKEEDLGGPLGGPYEDLMDLSDEDEEEHLEKKKAKSHKKTNATKPKRGGNANPRSNTRALRLGQPSARGPNRPTHEQPQQGPLKRPRQTYEQAPNTSPYKEQSYGNQTLNTNQQADRWQPAARDDRYNYAAAAPAHTSRPPPPTYREDPAGQSYVDEYNVGAEDATHPQTETYYLRPQGRRPFRGDRRGGRGPRHATSGRQPREEGHYEQY